MASSCHPVTAGSSGHGYIFSMVGGLGDRTVLAAFPPDKIFIGQAVWTVLVLLASFVLIWVVVPAVASSAWFVAAVEGGVGLVGTVLLLPEDLIRSRWAITGVLRKVVVGYGLVIAKVFDLLTVIIGSALLHTGLVGPSRLRKPVSAGTSTEMNQSGLDAKKEAGASPAAAGRVVGTSTDAVVPAAIGVFVVLCFLWWNQNRCVPGSPVCVHPLSFWVTTVGALAKGSG